MSASEDKRLLDMIEDSWWRMSRPPEPTAWRPPATETNPGSFKPQDQQLHALPAIDQTRSIMRLPGGRVESNGQREMLDLHHKDNGVKASFGAPVIPRSFDGQFQSKNLRPLNQAVTASVGAPNVTNVDVSAQNYHLPPTLTPLPTKAPTQVNPDARKHGSGIPTTVNIR